MGVASTLMTQLTLPLAIPGSGADYHLPLPAYRLRLALKYCARNRTDLALIMATVLGNGGLFLRLAHPSFSPCFDKSACVKFPKSGL